MGWAVSPQKIHRNPCLRIQADLEVESHEDGVIQEQVGPLIQYDRCPHQQTPRDSLKNTQSLVTTTS